MKAVTVIVPVYNVEKYLEKCLDSLVQQTLQDIEIVVVDDGSTDGSPDIIRHYTEKFPDKIKAYRKENGGLSEARNYGIDRAAGAYIGFVDSDDYVEREMFESLYLLAQQHDAEMVVCNLQKVDEQGRLIRKLPQIPNLPEKILLAQHFSIFADLSYFACNKLFHRKLFNEYRFTPQIHFEDIELVPRLLLECKTIAHSHRYFYHYLQRDNSITKQHDERGLDMLRAVARVEQAFACSAYSHNKAELKGFQILEGVYSFLAYLVFVKNEGCYQKMSQELKDFIKARGIKRIEILRYRRFEKNYLLSLSLKKMIYYLLYFLGQERLIRKWVK